MDNVSNLYRVNQVYIDSKKTVISFIVGFFWLFAILSSVIANDNYLIEIMKNSNYAFRFACFMTVVACVYLIPLINLVNIGNLFKENEKVIMYENYKEKKFKKEIEKILVNKDGCRFIMDAMFYMTAIYMAFSALVLLLCAIIFLIKDVESIILFLISLSAYMCSMFYLCTFSMELIVNKNNNELEESLKSLDVNLKKEIVLRKGNEDVVVNNLSNFIELVCKGYNCNKRDFKEALVDVNN